MQPKMLSINPMSDQSLNLMFIYAMELSIQITMVIITFRVYFSFTDSRPPNTPIDKLKTPPPKDKTPPPPKDKTPPPKDKTPPPKDKTPPPKDKTPPPKDKTPPPKDKTPPPKDKTPPPKDKTPPPKDKTPPPKDKTPKDKTPPPKDKTPPPKDKTPPPKDKTPPPKEKTPPPTEKPKQKICVKGSERILDAAHNRPAVVDTEVTGSDLRDVREFGYGFWFRYLTRYPSQLLKGKNADWYFVSRLTSNQDHSDSKSGDRVLAIFQGQGNYLFATNDLHKSAPYEDIEGLWTYTYFSYSHKLEKATAFLSFPKEDAVKLEFDVTHDVPKYLRLILGGHELGIYPGLNGQYTRPILNIGVSSFLATFEEFKSFAVACNPQPKPVCLARNTVDVVDDVEVVKVDDRKPVEIVSDQPFPEEYAVVGWFKWRSTVQNPWHVMFRLTINDKLTNQNDALLGDRDLGAWVGSANGGLLHFATYSYTNLVGDG